MGHSSAFFNILKMFLLLSNTKNNSNCANKELPSRWFLAKLHLMDKYILFANTKFLKCLHYFHYGDNCQDKVNFCLE